MYNIPIYKVIPNLSILSKQFQLFLSIKNNVHRAIKLSWDVQLVWYLLIFVSGTNLYGNIYIIV